MENRLSPLLAFAILAGFLAVSARIDAGIELR